MRTDELDYHLPERLIATEPATPRDAARMLVVSRSDRGRLEHRRVRDLPELLEPADLLVFNRSRVLPARFLGVREDTRGRVQGLYLREGDEPQTWVAMVKSRRFRAGAPIRLLNRAGEPADVRLTLLRRAGEEEPGAWVVRVEGSGNSEQILDRVGHPPLPPYIRAARKRAGAGGQTPDDLDRYQTVFAREAGSVAAPTAGLHFTPGLLDALDRRGVERTSVLLHVGTGTFKPVETETLEAHAMHSEWCSLGEEPARAVLERAEGRRGGRVLAVGTTAVRTLEAYAMAHARTGVVPPSMETDLLIAPGHRFAWVQGVMTNFHLPRSTLLALVAALFPDGMDRVGEIYAEAIRERYRFYSYGDAMLILP